MRVNYIDNLDCLEGMKAIPDGSVDMILCDLPYGTTACKWDTVIPFEPLWEQYERLIKDNGAIILFGSEPFTSLLICSNLAMFKYDIVWDKVNHSGGMLAKKRPLKSHENIIVFYKKQPTYNPQMTIGKMWHRGGKKMKKLPGVYGQERLVERKTESDTTALKYPKTILTCSNADNTKRVHPTQKPVELFEYLINTFTNPGDIVLDNCMGSGTTAVAALRTGRNFIGFELSAEYCQIAEQRIADTLDEMLEGEGAGV